MFNQEGKDKTAFGRGKKLIISFNFYIFINANVLREPKHAIVSPILRI